MPLGYPSLAEDVGEEDTEIVTSEDFADRKPEVGQPSASWCRSPKHTYQLGAFFWNYWPGFGTIGPATLPQSSPEFMEGSPESWVTGFPGGWLSKLSSLLESLV